MSKVIHNLVNFFRVFLLTMYSPSFHLVILQIEDVNVPLSLSMKDKNEISNCFFLPFFSFFPKSFPHSSSDFLSLNTRMPWQGEEYSFHALTALTLLKEVSRHRGYRRKWVRVLSRSKTYVTWKTRLNEVQVEIKFQTKEIYSK